MITIILNLAIICVCSALPAYWVSRTFLILMLWWRRGVLVPETRVSGEATVGRAASKPHAYAAGKAQILLRRRSVRVS